ncbi:MAG: hypothetical protein RLZZ428_805, partial [Pseudomonadota bacterium]
LLVRVAISDDAENEVAETFTLSATNTGGNTTTGTATIVDNDRPLEVFGERVTEGKTPYMVFTVRGGDTQSVKFDTVGGSATRGVDYGDGLEYWDGSAWRGYTRGQFVQLSEGSTLVRMAVARDNDKEGTETVFLQVESAGGNQAQGVGEIVDQETPFIPQTPKAPKETPRAQEENRYFSHVEVTEYGRVVIEFAGQYETVGVGVVEVRAFKLEPNFVRLVVSDTEYAEGEAKFEMYSLDGSKAPEWLKIDPNTGEITGTPPSGFSETVVQVKIIGKNGKVKTVDVEIKIKPKGQAALEGTLSARMAQLAPRFSV